MPSSRFEPVIPATKRLHTYSIGRAATGISNNDDQQQLWLEEEQRRTERGGCRDWTQSAVWLRVRNVADRELQIKSLIVLLVDHFWAMKFVPKNYSLFAQSNTSNILHEA
jgi:hypothetical protein